MRIIRKLTLLTVVATAIMLVPAGSLYAAEINPEPGTYTPGSTSELSPYVVVPGNGANSDSSSGGTLADTGQDARRIMLLAAVLLAVGGGAIGARYFIGRKKSA